MQKICFYCCLLVFFVSCSQKPEQSQEEASAGALPKKDQFGLLPEFVVPKSKPYKSEFEGLTVHYAKSLLYRVHDVHDLKSQTYRVHLIEQIPPTESYIYPSDFALTQFLEFSGQPEALARYMREEAKRVSRLPNFTFLKDYDVQILGKPAFGRIFEYDTLHPYFVSDRNHLERVRELYAFFVHNGKLMQVRFTAMLNAYEVKKLHFDLFLDTLVIH